MTDYTSLPAPPADITPCTLLNHVLDSLGFRFYWATEGLEDGDLGFQPSAGAMTLGRELAHIRRLLVWTNLAMQGRNERVKEVEEDFETMRAGTFEALEALKSTIASIGPDGLCDVSAFGLPFWNLVNGPITDCLTHTGQINVYRRMLGKPARAINYFTGQVS